MVTQTSGSSTKHFTHVATHTRARTGERLAAPSIMSTTCAHARMTHPYTGHNQYTQQSHLWHETSARYGARWRRARRSPRAHEGRAKHPWTTMGSLFSHNPHSIHIQQTTHAPYTTMPDNTDSNGRHK